MSASSPGHVLVIGVDGVRFDLLGPGTTPAIWALGQDGFLAPVRIDAATPTWSGPCWATIATGAGVAGHGVTGNDLTGHRLADHPDFVTRATRAGLSTLLAVSGWPPLALAEDGGPLFAEATRREFPPYRQPGQGRSAWRPGIPPTRPPPNSPRDPGRRTDRGCRSSTWAPSTSPGTSPVRARYTAPRPWPPTGGWHGCWPRSGPVRPGRGKLDGRGGHRPWPSRPGRARRPRTRGRNRVGGRRRTGYPAGRPAADHPSGAGRAAGPGRSRLVWAGRSRSGHARSGHPG